MRNEEWAGLGDEALQHLLVHRWIQRGSLLCLVFLAAIVATLLGARGAGGLGERLAAGGLLALSLAAAVAVFLMRQRDLEIHRELRRRRSARPGARG